MINTNNEFCTGCGACSNICPQKCISMRLSEEGFFRPVVDITNCILCNRCNDVCQIGVDFSEMEPECYAAYSKDTEIRNNSSSGGVFSELCKGIFNCNGVVYGASMNKALEVEHVRITEWNAINRLRGSKYLQSKTGNVYQSVREDLKSGLYVLFSGTPCQVLALKMFLGMEYTNLLLVDVACHGVPSYLAWNKYLENKNHQIETVYFRDKISSWNNYNVTEITKNGKRKSTNHWNHMFQRAYIIGAIQQESCYSCEIRGKRSAADITLADFWGVEDSLHSFDDDRGTSAVMIHSQKGKKAFDAIRGKVECTRVEFSQIALKNTSIVKPLERPPFRDSFLIEIKDQKFSKILMKYSPNGLKYNVYKVFRAIIG